LFVLPAFPHADCSFVAKLEEAGVPHEYHTIPNTSHASIASNFDRNDALPLVQAFVRRHHRHLHSRGGSSAYVAVSDVVADCDVDS
jgi:hypothetical protein